MQFKEMRVKGSYLITPELKQDERGFFGRIYCENEFTHHGLETRFVQMNNSGSLSKGTLRGLHYQLSPAEEVKLVRCVRGALWDVVLDLRPDSESFRQWDAAILNEENRQMLYIPQGCAHGFLTLQDDTEVIYLVSAFYSSALERGVRWNDSSFAIDWPEKPVVISKRDCEHPNYVMEALV